jgi:hypothetical protein
MPKVVTKNDFPWLGVEPESLDPKANTLPTEPPRPRPPDDSRFLTVIVG